MFLNTGLQNKQGGSSLMNLYDYETDIPDFVLPKAFRFWTSLNCCPENMGEKKKHLQHSLFVVKYLLLPTLE